MPVDPPIVTRFAPSPTGLLHLGHAHSALAGWRRARAAGGRFLLRIEDIDPGRCRPEFTTAIQRALSSAPEHFGTMRARLKARAQAGIDTAAQAKAEGVLEDALENLVRGILASPVITLDAIGACILSDKPWWDEPDWDPELARGSKK